MSRRAILQIGTEKTGTTTLQRFLANNRARLAAKGLSYPAFCGRMNHTGLAAFALDPARTDDIREPFGARREADVAGMRSRLHAAAVAELAGGGDAIFCNEHCHSRLTSAAEVATLRDFLAEFFDEVQISVYLRRQDQVAMSLYSTGLKSGGVDPTILPSTNAADPYFNYDRSLALWEDAFGRDNVHVRLFDRSKLVGGSIVDDFLAVWKLGSSADYASVPDSNESIRPVAQEFLRRINPHLRPIAGLPLEELRGPLAARLAALLPGPGAKPARRDAEAFYAMFRPSNEAVRARYFPDRANLFDEDFSGYPEVGAHAEITVDDVVAVAAGLHMAATREIRRLEAEIAVRDARLNWACKEPAAAEAALHRALEWRPDHFGAYRTLAEYRLQQDRLDEAVAAATRATELAPGAYEYWHFLGMVHRRRGDLDRAAEAQAKALLLAPDHGPSRREAEQVRLAQAAREPRPAPPTFQTDGSQPCRNPPSA